jgi:hypothetical protein
MEKRVMGCFIVNCDFKKMGLLVSMMLFQCP